MNVLPVSAETKVDSRQMRAGMTRIRDGYFRKFDSLKSIDCYSIDPPVGEESRGRLEIVNCELSILNS